MEEIKNTVEFLAVGGSCAAVGFLIGWISNQVLGKYEPCDVCGGDKGE